MGDATDLDLLEAWKAGRRDAGNELIERHFQRVFRFFRRRLPDAADDLTQRTFLGLLEGATVEVRTTFRAYVLGAARNQLWMELRHRHHRPDDDDAAISQLVVTTRHSPSRIVARQRERELLDRAMACLPLEQLLVIELHYWEQLTTREIGEVLGIPPGTVKWRLARARERLEAEVRKAEAPADLRRSVLNDVDALIGSE